MNGQNKIPAEMLDAATEAIKDLGAQILIGLCSSHDIAQVALEAAGVPALLDERDGLRFVHGELSEVTREAQAEVRELRARVAELESGRK